MKIKKCGISPITPRVSEMKRSFILLVIFVSISPFITGCTTMIPKKALALEEQSLEWRTMQSRKFDTNDEMKILTASAGLLQDLGFTLEESESKLGLVVGSKDRSAVEAGQVLGSALVGALTGIYMPTDQNQKLKASVVTRPYGDTKNTVIVRVTFQRVVWNSYGQISRLERLNEPEYYKEFFTKLSQAVFLEANEI